MEMTKCVDFSAAFLSKKGPRYCLQNKKGWLGPRDGLGAVKKKKKSAVCLSDNKNKHSTYPLTQEDDVTSENPLLRQTELGVRDAPSAAP